MATAVPFRRTNPNTYDPKLPHSLVAEKTALGVVLLNNEAFAAFEKKHFAAADFFLAENRKIFEAMRELRAEGSPVDAVILTDRLHNEGKLESCGGAAYISQLGDGVPAAMNIGHYVEIIQETAARRRIVYETEDIQRRALEGGWKVADLSAQLLAAASAGTASANHGALVAVDSIELLTMTLPDLEYVIEPLLPLRGRGMIFSPRGGGKTFVTMEIAYSIAAGEESAFVWRVPKARRVIYVDGEMHAVQLRDRARQIFQIHQGKEPAPGMLQLVTRDFQKDTLPKINSPEGRHNIEGMLREGDVLILDNLASLAASGDDKETDEWAEIESWLITLSWHGIATIFVHHAGKSGEQRGTSKREDLVDFVLRLKTPNEYRVEEGLRTEAWITKLRGQIRDSRWGQPFEIKLQDREWLMRPLREILRERAKEMLQSGMKPNDVAQETGLSRYSIHRLKKSMGDSTQQVDL
jgi:DnaB-like helicase N terminal domain/AAA domain